MKKVIAHELAKAQRAISVAEFFEKNRHLLGFDNKRKALLTVVKEAVDNALDACEEAKILPELKVELTELAEDRYRVVVEDNGPGIVPEQIPNIFGKLLYGSKFHRLRQARGQQGIGISAAVLYSQLTTGKPARILSKISPKADSWALEIMIDVQRNEPKIVSERRVVWQRPHGTRIELEVEGNYQKGSQSADEYLKETAIVNPHATIIYLTPKAEQLVFARSTSNLPKEPKEIKPHPYGIELGTLLKLAATTKARTLSAFLCGDFCRIGPGTAREICAKAGLSPKSKPGGLGSITGERLLRAISQTKIVAPPTDCISPIGSELLERGLKKEIAAEFYTSTTRAPTVYRGMPFAIEAALAYGGKLPSDRQITLLRFANRVPLLYQAGACAITKAVASTNWRSYGLSQSEGSLPVGPVVLAVHMASVWVPFTSEAKEAIAHYPEILHEVKLAVQECGRALASFVNKKRRVSSELQKKSYIERYLPHISGALAELLVLSQKERSRVESALKAILERSRKVEKLEVEKIDRSDALGLEVGNGSEE